jgi:hypothetical protein
MDDTNHWNEGYECDGCTKEFSSWHAKEQHMNAVGHQTRHYQTWNTASIQPLQTSTEAGENNPSNQNNEEQSSPNALEFSGTHTLGHYGDKLTSCITKYINSC